ncbi:hypothetical protein [Pectobacterium cacticida]|uniref:hypothetical protein n=1 Tax=Pectobacterium cacticida TaxID=69221 RepID=UPI002FF15E90
MRPTRLHTLTAWSTLPGALTQYPGIDSVRQRGHVILQAPVFFSDGKFGHVMLLNNNVAIM